MNRALASIEKLMADPAPGLVFGAHSRAGLPRRAHPSRHAWRTGMSEGERRELERLIGGTAALADVGEVYARANGVDLFYLKCPNCDEPHWGLSLLPVENWAEATARWQAGGECASFMEECDLFEKGTWRVIATFPSEGMNLVQFFSGEESGQALAGKIFCVGLDGYLGFDEEVAPSLSALMDEITQDPAAFFGRVGFGWFVDSDAGSFGDPIEKYVADVRGEPDAQPWPPTRARG